jgi:hypothetical protein
MKSVSFTVLCFTFASLMSYSTGWAAPPKTPSASSPPATSGATTANQFPEESQAKAHCPSDTVVWVNPNSKIYHFAGYRDYGKTKTGAYECEKDATGQGFRAAKSEKHPQ